MEKSNIEDFKFYNEEIIKKRSIISSTKRSLIKLADINLKTKPTKIEYFKDKDYLIEGKCNMQSPFETMNFEFSFLYKNSINKKIMRKIMKNKKQKQIFIKKLNQQLYPFIIKSLKDILSRNKKEVFFTKK